jgi:gas vesicle protein
MNRSRNILFGALIGAFTGLVAAMLLNRRAEKRGDETAITPGEGMKIGMLLFGLLRAISSLGDD